MQPTCKFCGANSRKVKSKTASGHWQIFWQCVKCGQNATGQFLKKDELGNWQYLPEVNRGYANPKCAVDGCEEVETAEHHFFPRSIAAKHGVNAEAWPKAWLCKAHHTLWHLLVTVGLLDEQWKG